MLKAIVKTDHKNLYFHLALSKKNFAANRVGSDKCLLCCKVACRSINSCLRNTTALCRVSARSSRDQVCLHSELLPHKD